MENIYYVYLLLDPRSFYLPFYVGKGKKDRARTHLWEKFEKSENRRKWFKINKIREAGFEPAIQYWATGLDELTAYDLEALLIARFGRAKIDPDGILTNICADLRPPSPLGRPVSEITKKKIGDKQRGELNHHFGKPCSEEDKALKRAWNLANGIVPPSNKGQKHSAETKAKMSAASKGKPKSEEHRRKLSEAAKLVKRGRPSDETIEKIRLSNILTKAARSDLQREITSENIKEGLRRRYGK